MVGSFLQRSFRLLLRVDVVFVLTIAFLVVSGCCFIYGTGTQAGGGFSHYWVRQLLWVGVGGVCSVAVCRTDYRVLGRWSWLLYAASLFLLVLVLVKGQRINQARSWLPMFGGNTLQPAELAKPATLLFLAHLASRPYLQLNRVWNLVPLVLAAAVPMLLIGLQPDWGTALVFVPIVVAVVFVAGLRWRVIALAAVLTMAAAVPLYQYGLAPHQRDRIRTFLAPASDVTDAGWNAHQSVLAVGSGGVWGKGFLRGTQYVLGFVPRPVAPTDFVFSVMAEETGFVGSVAVVCAFAGLLLGCVRAAWVAADDLGAYVAVGVAALFLTHAYINIGMTVRAAPIIGIPLPFVSYGGSFMLSCMICAGLVQSVYVRRPER